MAQRFIIGLDYGTESARGVLIDVATGTIVKSATMAYPHGVMAEALPSGVALGRNWALQDARDYTQVAEHILKSIGDGMEVEGIGLGFTASSPLPALEDGTPLSARQPDEPHAYVKLWKHGAAQGWADRINARRGAFLANFGGKVSGEWLLAKAWQMAEEAADLWAGTAKFIEGGDWLVWQLTGHEARSLGLAAYKAQYIAERGYPQIFEGLGTRLAAPLAIGSSAGPLSDDWRRRTGIRGRAEVAVAAIDSHLILPAVGATASGTLAAALGTSAVYLALSDDFKPLPNGIEGVAKDGSVRGLWCYEAGQAGFGDTLQWFVNLAPRSSDTAGNFRLYNEEAARLPPGGRQLVALDWWTGNRVPHADSRLSGLLMGLTRQTTAADIYRALMESICFGGRSIIDLYAAGGLPIERIVMGSGLASNNPLLVQIMADVLGRRIEVPLIDHASAVGAAIHGAVAAGTVASYSEGSERFGAREFRIHEPDSAASKAYEQLYGVYRSLAGEAAITSSMHTLNAV
jgi:L-ribulokinase